VTLRLSWTRLSMRLFIWVSEGRDTVVSPVKVRFPRFIPLFARSRLPRLELSKLGTGSQGFLFIKVSNLDDHFLVFIITEEGFRQALVHVRKVREQEKTIMVISAIAWLDMSRIRGWNSNEDDEIVLEELEKKRKRGDGDVEMIDNWDGGDSSVKQRRAEDGSHILGGSSRTERWGNRATECCHILLIFPRAASRLTPRTFASSMHSAGEIVIFIALTRETESGIT
jgi:hypothetical protein